jgi:hypothetical protein
MEFDGWRVGGWGLLSVVVCLCILRRRLLYSAHEIVLLCVCVCLFMCVRETEMSVVMFHSALLPSFGLNRE